MKKTMIGILAAAVAFVPVAAAQSEERFDEDAFEHESPERVVAPLHIDWPTRGVVAKNGEEKIVFRAPSGAAVELIGPDGEKLAEAVGAGRQPVSLPVPPLAVGEVHVLELRMLVEGVEHARPLPPILITEDGKVDLRRIVGIGSAIDSDKRWDFNGDGAYQEAADIARDVRDLMLRLPTTASLAPPAYENRLERFVLWSGNGEPYDIPTQGQNLSVTVPYGTDLSDLMYEYVVSSGSKLIAPETPDYTEPVVLRVRSPLGAERLYWLNVEVGPAPEPGDSPFDVALWTETVDGLWHVYDASTPVRNGAVGTYVTLPAGDGSDGYLPVSPFSGKSLWYGNGTVTDNVYETGNYVNVLSEYASPLDGGRSEFAHSGSIESPAVTVTADVYDQTLSFWYWYEIESNSPESFDEMWVAVEPIGGETPAVSRKLNPTTYEGYASDLPHTSGGYDAAPVWKRYELELGDDFNGQQVRVKLFFSTDDTNYNGFRGWFADQFYLGANRVPSIGKPVLSGTPVPGATLTASYNGFADADGDMEKPAKYAWWASADGGVTWMPLPGNAAALTVQQEHIGMQLKVDVYPYDGKQYGDAQTSDAILVAPGLS